MYYLLNVKMVESEPPSTTGDADSEMDKALKFEKQKQESATRLRKINSVAEKLLQVKIQSLSADFLKRKVELKRKISSLEDELKEIDRTNSFPTFVQSSSCSLVESRLENNLVETPSRPGTQESSCQSCIFGTKTSQCKHFPCYLPVTYSCLGFKNRPSTYSVVRDYDKLLRRCHDRRPVTKAEIREEAKNLPSVEDLLKTPPMARVTIKEKERGLNQLVKEMKERNEKTKPRDWATNYGAPVSRRVLLKPVVPVRDNI